MKSIQSFLVFLLATSSLEAFAITPFNLAYKAYRGQYRDGGIRGYGAFCNQWIFEKQSVIAALIGNALMDESLIAEEATPQYESELQMQIESICRR